METPVGVQIIDDAIRDCDAILKHLDSLDRWQPSTVRNEQQGSKFRTSESIAVPFLSWQNDPLIHEMNGVVWKALDAYAQQYEFRFAGVEDVTIQRYQIGDFYAPHTDHDMTQPRVVSAVAYLNTVKKGGGTRFTRFDYTVEPVAGRIAIFPANYIFEHEALAPLSGVKVAAAYWAQG